MKFSFFCQMKGTARQRENDEEYTNLLQKISNFKNFSACGVYRLSNGFCGNVWQYKKIFARAYGEWIFSMLQNFVNIGKKFSERFCAFLDYARKIFWGMGIMHIFLPRCDPKTDRYDRYRIVWVQSGTGTELGGRFDNSVHVPNCKYILVVEVGYEYRIVIWQSGTSTE